MSVTVLDYLEEQTSMIPDSEIPSSFLHAQLVTVADGILTFEEADETADYYDDEDYESASKSGSHPVLEVTAELNGEETQFILVSPDGEGWYYFTSLEDYLEDAFDDLDAMSYDYEVLEFEKF